MSRSCLKETVDNNGAIFGQTADNSGDEVYRSKEQVVVVVASPLRHERTIIYVFTLAGYWYAGKRKGTGRNAGMTAGQRGFGPLPDGYTGSGRIWKNVLAKHDASRMRWRIAAVLEAPTKEDIHIAEGAAIQRIREKFARVGTAGGRCCNLREGFAPTSADMKRLYENPEYRAANAETMRRLHEEPELRAKRAIAAAEAIRRPEVRAKLSGASRRKAQDPEFRAKHVAVTTEAAQRRALDPEWRAANAEQNRRPEVRAKLAQSLGSIPAAPPETLTSLRSFLLSAPKSWSKRELFARATLRVPGVPAWQFAQVCNEAGIEVRKSNVNTNVLRHIQTLLPTIVVAEDQSAGAFVARVLELKASGLSNARAEWQTALERPNVSQVEASRAAREAGHARGSLEYEIGLARTLARIIREEAAPPPSRSLGGHCDIRAP